MGTDVVIVYERLHRRPPLAAHGDCLDSLNLPVLYKRPWNALT